jgi:hypothetical protein
MNNAPHRCGCKERPLAGAGGYELAAKRNSRLSFEYPDTPETALLTARFSIDQTGFERKKERKHERRRYGQVV